MGWLENVSARLEGEKDEEEWLGSVSRRLNAGQAAPSLYAKSQAEAIEAAGDIFGIDTPAITSYKEQKEQELEGLKLKHPESLFETKDPAGWWAEKATLNYPQQVVPYVGYTVGTILQAVPHPIAKGLGALINTGTFATQYTANFADTLQEHEDRAGRPLTEQEKAWAAVVSGGVVALDRLVPSKLGKDVVKKLGGAEGIKQSRQALIKQMNQARQKLGASLYKGGKYALGAGGSQLFG